MADADRTEFFASGEHDVASTFDGLTQFAPGFRPALAVDFGCGVGRLTIPIAARSGRVLGVDVSAPMLAEAERNCTAHGVSNVRFVLSESLWAALLESPPDFVHSYIVFQHITPTDGLPIAAGLLERLKVGGVGALHFVHQWRPGRARRLVSELRRAIAPLNAALNAVQGRPLFEPSIPMFEYDETAVRDLLRRNRCDPVSVVATNHGGFLGAMYLFRKAPN